MLKILQVNTADLRGGAETVARNLHLAYRERGHVSWLAVGRAWSDDPNVWRIGGIGTPSGLGQSSRWFGEALSALESMGRGMKWLGGKLRIAAEPQHFFAWAHGYEDFDFPGTQHLIESCPERPDIVHCHNLHGNYFDLRFLPRLSHEVPTVVTLHDAWLLSGHCAHSFDCERWKTGCGRCPDLSIYPSVRRDATDSNWERKQQIYSRSQLHVTTPSRWLMQKVEQSMLAPAVIDARIIPNGVDLSVFHPARMEEIRPLLDIPGDAKVLLFAANGIRPNVFKDFRTMQSAVALLARRLRGERIVFVALGEDAPPERLDGAQIRFVGYEENPLKVAKYYQAADVYVHAARADNFPLTVLEALACGVPVVATDVGGISEQVEHRRTGFLVPPADAESMAERIESLLMDEGLRQRLSASAASDAAERFDLSRQAEQYLAWYQTILGSSSNA